MGFARTCFLFKLCYESIQTARLASTVQPSLHSFLRHSPDPKLLPHYSLFHRGLTNPNSVSEKVCAIGLGPAHFSEVIQYESIATSAFGAAKRAAAGRHRLFSALFVSFR